MAIENHPIPQDVTGFKFKLVGSITVKQFGYLLGGGILATVIFVLPIFFIIKVPFILIFFLLGLGLAFVPIDGRPMDKMIMNFIKTVPHENQFLYHKKGVNLAILQYLQPPKVVAPKPQKVTAAAAPDNSETQRKNLFLAELRKTSYKTDPQETAFLNNIKSYYQTSPVGTPIAPTPAAAPAPIIPSPSVTIPATPVAPVQSVSQASPAPLPISPLFSETARPVRVLSMDDDAPKPHVSAPAARLPRRETPQPPEPIIQKQEPAPTAAPIKPSFPITPEMPESTQQQIVHAVQQQFAESAASAEPAAQNSSVRVVKADSQLQAGFPTLPDIPNVILGIIRDPRGKVLPNIIVEVVDASSIPVRAFKTNALGQFAAATPLPNGTYTISFEDTMHKNEFRSVTFTLDGTIFQPLEVTSVDQRERLRQELFGAQV